MDLCKFQELQLIENWWEANPLVKVDLSNNEIDSIPEDLATQEVSIATCWGIFEHVESTTCTSCVDIN